MHFCWLWWQISCSCVANPAYCAHRERPALKVVQGSLRCRGSGTRHDSVVPFRRGTCGGGCPVQSTGPSTPLRKNVVEPGDIDTDRETRTPRMPRPARPEYFGTYRSNWDRYKLSSSHHLQYESPSRSPFSPSRSGIGRIAETRPEAEALKQRLERKAGYCIVPLTARP